MPQPQQLLRKHNRYYSKIDLSTGTANLFDHVEQTEVDRHQNKVNCQDVHYVGTLQEASDYLGTALQSGDVLLTLGAGDGYLVGETVLRTLAGTRKAQTQYAAGAA